jgi:hypothetical protein
MPNRRHTTITWDQVATRLPLRSGIKWKQTLLPRVSHQDHSSGESVQRIGFSLKEEHWTRRQGSAFMAQDCKKAVERLFYAQRATASGAFRPNREKDELTNAIGTTKHDG